MNKILNQGPEGKCCNFSWIAALQIMDKNLDINKLLEETKTAPNLLTSGRALNWFKERGYVKGIQKVTKVQLKLLLARNIPVIVKMNGINWDVTSKPPFICEGQDRIGAHVFILVSIENGLIKCQNSYGEKWGDKGYFYLPEALWSRLQDTVRLII